MRSLVCGGSEEKRRGPHDTVAADVARDGGTKMEETGKRKKWCTSSSSSNPSSSSGGGGKQVGKRERQPQREWSSVEEAR